MLRAVFLFPLFIIRVLLLLPLVLFMYLFAKLATCCISSGEPIAGPRYLFVLLVRGTIRLILFSWGLVWFWKRNGLDSDRLYVLALDAPQTLA